jgi:hypothetical protein
MKPKSPSAKTPPPPPPSNHHNSEECCEAAKIAADVLRSCDAASKECCDAASCLLECYFRCHEKKLDAPPRPQPPPPPEDPARRSTSIEDVPGVSGGPQE